jgi:hypothetical protein
VKGLLPRPEPNLGNNQKKFDDQWSSNINDQSDNNKMGLID